jgi:G3E family GTPase
MLDRRFGKLTRARLDCVVTVVDTDLLCKALEQRSTDEPFLVDPLNAWLGDAFRLQVQSADLVVLNKIDLVTSERLHSAELFVRQLNPLCHCIEASHGRVPIEALLQVELSNATEGLSHEVSIPPRMPNFHANNAYSGAFFALQRRRPHCCPPRSVRTYTRSQFDRTYARA